MWNKFTACVLTAIVAIVGALVIGYILLPMELAKDTPGLSVIVCFLVMLVAILLINIFTGVK